jgi:acyl-CoA-binding protein
MVRPKSESTGVTPMESTPQIDYMTAMTQTEEFAAAQVRVKQLKQTPQADELLELYALYKQATLGDVQGTRPGMLDFKGRAKFDAWAGQKGISADAAMERYAALVARLQKVYG